MDIYEKLTSFIEGEIYDLAELVYEENDLTPGDLKETSEIIDLFNNAIEELLEDTYEGEALEIVTNLFQQIQDEFIKSHIGLFMNELSSLAEDKYF